MGPHLSSGLGFLQVATSGAESMAVLGGISDALRQYMVLHLDVQHIVQLASSCRAWHELISQTTVNQLSDSVRHALLPLGLTSELPLQEL